MKSYHPISLLNQDYKIFMAVLTKRLNKIIGFYVHSDQSGFIPNRDILDNVYRTLELIHHGRLLRQHSLLILSLDIEKAFDRVEHLYLLTLLDHMGFGSKFLTALKTIYASPTASVKVNGCSSEPFPISRETRQGCPLSPLLFALAIGPLVEALHSSQQYWGFHIGDQEHKLSMFADDMALYVADPVDSLPHVEEILDIYQEVSGLNVNRDKSVLYPIALSYKKEQIITECYSYHLIKDHWKYLGVKIPVDFMNFSKLNLETVDSSVKTTLQKWNNKCLSWFKRIQIIKTMLFLKYLFLFWTAPLDITPKLLKSWQQMLLNFIWQYK